MTIKEFGHHFVDRLTDFGAHIHDITLPKDDSPIEDSYDLRLTYHTTNSKTTSDATIWTIGGQIICSFRAQELIATDSQVIMAEMGFNKMLTTDILRGQHHVNDLIIVSLDIIMHRAICLGNDIALYNILNTNWDDIVDEYCSVNKILPIRLERNIEFSGDIASKLLNSATKSNETKCVAILLRYKHEQCSNSNEEVIL